MRKLALFCAAAFAIVAGVVCAHFATGMPGVILGALVTLLGFVVMHAADSADRSEP